MMTLHCTETGQSLGTIHAYQRRPIERNAWRLTASCLATSTALRLVTGQ